jgi:activator of HSP90 ATPase
MKSKGLGDSVEKFTKATGIKKVVDSILGDCGCSKRKEKLNKVFPYKR